jgi:hypothetical protein
MTRDVEMPPRVKTVEAMPDYQLKITFTDGQVGVYDCRPLLDFGVFRELKDEGSSGGSVRVGA